MYGSICDTRGNPIPSSSTQFSQFKLADGIQRGIAEAGFTEPRPIQAQTIPATLEGRDVLGLAQTGTGKTAAFALPTLERLLQDPGKARRGPRALIVAPTRELAAQIQAEIELLARFTKIRTTVVFGGVGQRPQVRALASKPEILVACPGRLLDLVQQRVVSLDSVEVLVLDEADHMFDMGFLPDIRRILRALPERRQNLLFSATMPREIRGLADEVLRRPVVVELAHSAPAETIEHALYPVGSNEDKVALLRHLLDGDDFTSAIVFLRTKHRAKRLALQLAKQGHNAVALQGNMSQNKREQAMKGFRSGHYDVLVATDIAARGIDVADVSHVVNFDVPNTPDAYTHRIGRTGRSEKSGKAFTFVTADDVAAIRAIERRIGSTIPEQKVEGFTSKGHRSSSVARGPRQPAPAGRGRRTRATGPKPVRSRAGRTQAASTRPARTEEPAREPKIPFGAFEQPKKSSKSPTKRAKRRRRQAKAS